MLHLSCVTTTHAARWLLGVVLVGCGSPPEVLVPDAIAFELVSPDRSPSVEPTGSLDEPVLDGETFDSRTIEQDIGQDASLTIDVSPCLPGRSFCDGRCVDPLTDPMHCGACGLQCPDTAPTCLCGACFGGCAPDLLTCCRPVVGTGAVCADPRRSDEHCGRCGNRCVAGMRCVDGVCEATLADCDPSNARCDAPPPRCTTGHVPSVRAGCWGPCVPFERCLPIPCPDAGPCPHGWRCVPTIFTCQP